MVRPLFVHTTVLVALAMRALLAFVLAVNVWSAGSAETFTTLDTKTMIAAWKPTAPLNGKVVQAAATAATAAAAAAVCPHNRSLARTPARLTD